MHYTLRLNSDNSRVDNLESKNIKEAKLFYMGRKHMDEKTFDDLYHIEKNPKNK